MSTDYDLDKLMGAYADWIAWLKEKEASLERQLTKMKGNADGGQETPHRPNALLGEGAGASAGDGESIPAASAEEAEITPSPRDEALDPQEPAEDTPPSPVSHPPSVAESDDDDWL